MKKDFIIDYIGYITIKLFGPLIRLLPLALSFFLARRLGDILYTFDLKHRAVAYSNIRKALGDKLSCGQIRKTTREFYQHFCMNILELFLIPRIDKKYIKKYIDIEGVQNLKEAFKVGKGVIIASAHFGSWELSGIIAAYLDCPFNLFVASQRYPRLDKLLNSYRVGYKGSPVKIIYREDNLRHLIKALKNNEAVGITADQGGKAGVLVKFFERQASMPEGAVFFAKRFSAALIPVFYSRINGPYIKVVIGKPLQPDLETLVSAFEKHIALFPSDYLWTYKIWKYGLERKILILSDGKTGHLRQAQGLARITEESLREKGFSVEIETVEIKFKHKFARTELVLSSCLSGKYNCQGCLLCFKWFLEKDTYNALAKLKPDVIISCGSSLAAVNYIFSRENLAKSIVVTRPSFLSFKRFDLVVMPKHDRPIFRKNVVVTQGALNLVSQRYLKEQVEKLVQSPKFKVQGSKLYIGLLLGGDTKRFYLNKDVISEVIRQVKIIAEEINADILVSTSRRTSKDIEDLVKVEFKDYPQCKLLVIANEDNILEAVGGILGLSNIIVTSPESISMISEAASSGKYVFVFKAEGLSRKHQDFIRSFAENKYIYLSNTVSLGQEIGNVWKNKPQVRVPDDNLVVKEAIKKLL